jgi:iron(III) transport system substrate-binding protein
MPTRRSFALAGLALTTTACDVWRDVFSARLGNTPSHSALEADAAKEGALRIDVATGLLGDQDLMDTFKRLYPAIALDLRRAHSRELHTNFLQETHSGRQTADILISSAMDLQFKLVNDGFAQAYASPEKPHLPDWAVWKDEAYAISADPLVFAYNKALMPPEDVPDSHHGLTDLLRRKTDEYQGKVTGYDPQRSATGYLYYTQDLLLSRDTLDFVQALGRTRPKFYVSGVDVRENLSSGKHLLAYNMVNSYMIVRQSDHPDIAVVFPSDYTLVMSRIAFIPKGAMHPAAARLFLDFLLSELGQTLMARQYIQPIREGVPMRGSAPSPEILRRIQFGPSLLAHLDEFRRRRVLEGWRRALES